MELKYKYLKYYSHCFVYILVTHARIQPYIQTHVMQNKNIVKLITNKLGRHSFKKKTVFY